MTSVLVDATVLGRAGGDRGTGTYVRELLRELGRRDDITVSALWPRSVASPPGVRPVEVDRANTGRFQFLEHGLRLPVELIRTDSDVFHGPSATPPPRCRRGWVETIFDVIPLTHSDADLASERRRWHRIGGRFRRADAIIAASSHTASEAIRVLGLDPSKVYVAHLAAGRSFSPPSTRTLEGRSTFLFVGGIEQRKRISNAMAVVSALADAGVTTGLRVCGPLPPAHVAVVRDWAEGERVSGLVEVVGHIDDLAAEYHRAIALLVPSAAEGFGLPAVEAMACGTPVIAYANSAMSEVVADGGILVPDREVTEMAAAALRLASDPAAWSEASESALERARAFSWERCADIHAEVYRDVSARTG